MLQIFFTGFSTKKITKMLRKISRTHRKRFKNFCEENWTGKGANSKRTARNMQDRGVCITTKLSGMAVRPKTDRPGSLEHGRVKPRVEPVQWPI
jgi:hypothetical protein